MTVSSLPRRQFSICVQLKCFGQVSAAMPSAFPCEETAKKAKAEQEEWARREKMFLEVLEIDAEDTLANYGLGSIAVEKSDWEKARGYLEQVLAADPKYSVAYLALGKAYKGLGLKDKARETFTQGISVAAAKGDFMPANQMQSELDRI